MKDSKDSSKGTAYNTSSNLSLQHKTNSIDSNHHKMPIQNQQQNMETINAINVSNKTNKNFLEDLILKLKENKKSIIITLVGLGISYYIYRKVISPYINKLVVKIVNSISSDNNLGCGAEALNLKNPLQKFENYYTKTLKKILSFHKEKLDKFTSINELYNNLSNKSSRKDQITPMWIIFKSKVFLYFFSAIYSTRFSIIMNQIQVLLLERLRINQGGGSYVKVSNTIQDEILKENEKMLNDFSEIIFKKVENLIKPLCDEIQINSTFSLEGFMDLVKKFRFKIEEIIINQCAKEYYYKLFTEYKTKITEKIHIYENQDFYKSYSSLLYESKSFEYKNAILEQRINTEANFKFYSLLFDIYNSNVFTILMINSFEFDFDIIYETIKLNFHAININNIRITHDIPVAKILSFMMKIYENVLDEKKSIYFIKEFNGKQLNEVLNDVYRYLIE